MSFQVYKLKFDLYASHKSITNPEAPEHFHNFNIVLYLDKYGKELILFDDIEESISEWLGQFKNMSLHNVVPEEVNAMFIESVGDVFYSSLHEKLSGTGFDLIRLDISESPIHVYSVSNRLLDNSVNTLEYSPTINIPWSHPLVVKKQENKATVKNEKSEENETRKLQECENIQGLTCSKSVEELKAEQAIALNDYLMKSEDFWNTLIERELSNQSEQSNQRGQSNQREQANQTEQTNQSEQLRKLSGCEEEKTKECLIKPKPQRFLPKILKLLAAIGIIISASAAVMYSIKIGGYYPTGSDTFCHIYRADFIYRSIASHNFYPLYDPNWYNGVEIMRYWGPLPLYVLAFLQFIAGGDSMTAYLLFVGFIFAFGSFGWLLAGWCYNRIGLSVFLGMVWFFQPENMRVLFGDGNLPRALISALLPYTVYFMVRYLADGKWKNCLYIILLQALIGLCHGGIAVMIYVTFVLFLVIYGLLKKDFKKVVPMIICMLLAFALIGIWLFPALKGGIAAKGASTNQVMKNFFESTFISLNPIYRIQGKTDIFYFGLSVFMLSLFGLIYGRKEMIPGFITALLIFFTTSKSMYSIFSKLPISQYLWMERFIPGGIILALIAFLSWKGIKFRVTLILCLILLLDTIPSYRYIYNGVDAAENVYVTQSNNAENLLINDAKDMTKQRLAIMDLSRYGAFAPYYVAGVEPKVKYTFGAGWEGARTASNIVQINGSVSGGNYYYLFDRCLELGNDTVLLRTDLLNNKAKDTDKVIKAAEKSGYQLEDIKNGNLLFHRDTKGSFGVITDYQCIAIGASAKNIALLFPVFKEGVSIVLDDYTFEELSGYKKIYLSGFTYKNKEKTEELLQTLADRGVQIYIDMNKIPADSKTNRYEIFGVSAQVISFEDYFPKLNLNGSTYVPGMFSDTSDIGGEDLTTWNTVYLDGVKKEDGTFLLDGQQLVFAGRGDDDNIYFLGLNLPYHVLTSSDEEVSEILQNIFDISPEEVPVRKTVPIEIKYAGGKIVIQSEYEEVNTTLSSMDIFKGVTPFKSDNNLIIVDKGETIIDIKYPYFKQGLLLSCFGLGSSILYLSLLRKKQIKLQGKEG